MSVSREVRRCNFRKCIKRIFALILAPAVCYDLILLHNFGLAHLNHQGQTVRQIFLPLLNFTKNDGG